MTAPGPPRSVGRWVVEKELGRGGMGVVFQARDPTSGRLAAVKVMLDPDAEGQARFDRELQAMERLDHPGIVRLYERGRADGRVYAAMELVAGGPLPERLELGEVLEVGLQVARALEHAHSRGVLHRDLKPSNLLRDASGKVKVLDFGLARLSDRSRMTKTGATLGTPAYMPPEQVEGKADARSDVYGLGATLYALLTGAAPFRGGSIENLLVKVLTQTPPSCSSVRDDVPPGLDVLVLRCLEKEPERRPQTVTEVIDLLEGLRAGDDPVAVARRRRTIVLAAVFVMGVVVVLGGVAGGFAIRRRRRQEAAAAAGAADGAAARAAKAADAERAARAAKGETFFLQGELEAAQALGEVTGAQGATLRALLLALAPATAARAEEELAAAEPRPAVRAARLVARAQLDRADGPDLGPPVEAGPLVAALLARGDLLPALALAGWTDLEALPPAAKEALGRGLRELLRTSVGQATALLRRCAERLPAEVRSALAKELRAEVERLAEEVPLTAPPRDAREGLRKVLVPYRPLLLLEPRLLVEPPDAVHSLSGRAVDDAPAGRDREAVSAAQAAVDDFDARNTVLNREGRQAERPALYEEIVARLVSARAQADTPFGRSEVCCLAVDILCHQDEGHARAVEWGALACEGQALGRYQAVHAFALLVAGRLDEALRLLDAVIEDDPVDGDPLHIRAILRRRWVELDQGREDRDELLALAVADARRAAADRRESRRIRMRGGFKNAWLMVAQLEEMRGRYEAAWEACGHFHEDAAGKDGYHADTRRELAKRLGR